MCFILEKKKKEKRKSVNHKDRKVTLTGVTFLMIIIVTDLQKKLSQHVIKIYHQIIEHPTMIILIILSLSPVQLTVIQFGSGTESVHAKAL